MNKKISKIGIIGAGVMGSIFVNRLVETGLKDKEHILINDCDESKLIKIANYGTIVSNQKKLVQESSILILAVKPQDFKELASQLKGLISKEKMIISIMVGISIERIRNLLDVKHVVRAMPNIPSKIGKGIVVWNASDSINQEQRQKAKAIFRCLGKAIEVCSEQYVDMATAVSGSGPAYVFLFQEIFTKAAQNLGLPENIAKELSIETIAGAVALQKDSGADPIILRERVTSKGGTTEVAIKIFEENNLAKIFQMALKGAYERSQELKKQND